MSSSTNTMSPPNTHYGKRLQECCVEMIESLVIEEGIDTPLVHLLSRVFSAYRVPTRTLRRWYDHYLLWGECPYSTRHKVKLFQRKSKRWRRTKVITDEIVDALKDIVDENPEFYIDEIADELAKQSGCYLPISTIYTTLKEKVGYSLQVCYDSAAQRDEVERQRYKAALNALVRNPEQVIVIDETHKDRNASRRRKAWGPRNSGGLALRRWFRNEVRYTMIAALNLDGFVDSTIELVRRDEISNEGAAGTVDSEHFQNWVKDHLCPVLGSYERNEPNSIVIMDNASTHMSEEVREMIESAGAYLLYTAPYSPDLSPIEYAFNIYKAYLKRLSKEYGSDGWYDLHFHAYKSVSRDTSIMEFRKCGIPFSEDVPTSKEQEAALESAITTYLTDIE